jgi:hypothetical protein
MVKLKKVKRVEGEVTSTIKAPSRIKCAGCKQLFYPHLLSLSYKGNRYCAGCHKVVQERARKDKAVTAKCKGCGKSIYLFHPVKPYNGDTYCDAAECREKLMARIYKEKEDEKSGKGKKNDSRNRKRRVGNS